MAHCVTCGNELHPERAEKYDYCTKRECREQNAKPLTVVSVGVNKAADQYLILHDRTTGELAAGTYQDQRKSASVTGERSGLGDCWIRVTDAVEGSRRPTLEERT